MLRLSIAPCRKQMPTDEKSFHMTPDEFRRHGHAVVDWIADYQSRVESFPVLSQVEPGKIRASLPAKPPAQGEPFDALLRDVERLILPGVTHWQSPNYFAYFPCNTSGPGILGDLLSSGLGVQGMLWSTSPARLPVSRCLPAKRRWSIRCFTVRMDSRLSCLDS